jgi:hypothetical protein
VRTLWWVAPRPRQLFTSPQSTRFGAALTGNTPYGSLTFGAAVAVGMEASAGVRDVDRDGKREYCLRAGGGALGKVTVGLCLEDPR